VPGRWPVRVTAGLLDELIAVVDAERGAAPGEGQDWGRGLRSMVLDGDPRLDIRPANLQGHPTGRALLAEARARLDACEPVVPSGGDIVHCDFAPENALVRGGRLCGVVDWEQSRAGDASFDLVGLLFDMEAGPRATPAVGARLRNALAQRVHPALLAAYISLYAVRYASWAIGTFMEPEVLALCDRLAHSYLHETGAGRTAHD
jgi:Ser/Thr protein kinase RdoA (MazF antagonist)